MSVALRRLLLVAALLCASLAQGSPPVDDNSIPPSRCTPTAQSQGPNSGVQWNDLGGGDVPWVIPENAATSDDVRTTATFVAIDQTSGALAGTQWGFSVPAAATITGIIVEVERSSLTANVAQDLSIYLTKNGSATVGLNKSVAPLWPTTDAYQSYGGASDLWGTTWTAAEVNATTFGTLLSAFANDAGTARIDHVRITVHYTACP